MGIINRLMGNASAVSKEDIKEKYDKLLANSETVDFGFKLVRDTFIFTSKRLIIVDVQGLTGSKVEYLSLPYKNISRFSLETSGTFDLDAELKIWISSAIEPTVSKKFNRKVDVYEVQKYLADKTG